MKREKRVAGRLTGKVAAITGAASGIGAATARLFAAEGCRVILGDIQDELGTHVAADIGKSAVYLRADVTREKDVAALIDRAISEFGKLDVMFNDAGIVGAMGPIDTIPAEEWRATFDVLVDGVFYGIKHAARVMKPRRCGSIISMSSVGGVYAGLGPHAYVTAKHAVLGITRNAATELCHWGIRVNAIGPYAVVTPLAAAAYFGDHTKIEELRTMLTKGSPLENRAGTALDVANAALWLASDESGYTSGNILTVDAGITIGATCNDLPPFFSQYAPMIREADKRGLPTSG